MTDADRAKFLKNIVNHSFKEISDFTKNNEEYCKKLSSKLILGFYFKKYRCEVHDRQRSSVLLGILLKIHPIVLESHANKLTDMTIMEEFAIYEKCFYEGIMYGRQRLVPLIHGGYDDILIEFMRKIFTEKQLKGFGSPLYDETMEAVEYLVDFML